MPLSPLTRDRYWQEVLTAVKVFSVRHLEDLKGEGEKHNELGETFPEGKLASSDVSDFQKARYEAIQKACSAMEEVHYWMNRQADANEGLTLRMRQRRVNDRGQG
jgi:hypothetical protein